MIRIGHSEDGSASDPIGSAAPWASELGGATTSAIRESSPTGIRRRADAEAILHAAMGVASVAVVPISVVPFVYAAVMFVG